MRSQYPAIQPFKDDMKVLTLGTRISAEPPRSTAYYYADLERLKRKEDDQKVNQEEEERQNVNELSEYVESNEVVNDGAIREVPPFRDRQWSLPEYSTPENRKPDETYSTAGTFPMPEPKEKEPLLAELEVVGRLPLTQLESGPGVRRSRSWYLCCPNMGEEEVSRDSSWRYSSLRPVTAPPLPRQNGMITSMVATTSSRDDAPSLRAERDALARALSAERARATAAARAHDARLAELHGVIAELVRRRAADKAGAIPEEEGSDECESTTQPAGAAAPDPDDTTASEPQETSDDAAVEDRLSPGAALSAHCESCRLSERDSRLCVDSARCCQSARMSRGASPGGSADRERGSPPTGDAVTTGRCPSRQSKMASRVRLRRARDRAPVEDDDESWTTETAERAALAVCAQADLREALAIAANDGEALSATVSAWRARCARLHADARVLKGALRRATDTAQRVSRWAAAQESCVVCVCAALRAADRALEAYDVLLALQETSHTDGEQRIAATTVAWSLLRRLESERSRAAAVGEPLLAPGPWLQQTISAIPTEGPSWDADCERRLRSHAAKLKADTVALRALAPPPKLFSYHDSSDSEGSRSADGCEAMAEMEAAVTMQEVLVSREAAAAARCRDPPEQKPESSTRRGHWLESPAETDL